MGPAGDAYDEGCGAISREGVQLLDAVPSSSITE